MELQSFVSAVPSAFAAGVSPYFTLLVLALGVRLHWIQSPPSTLEFIGAWWMIAIVGVFYGIEVAMSVIPIPAVSKLIRILWNIIHQIVTPLAGALVGVATAGAASEATLSVAAMSSAIAIVPQTVKSASQGILDITPIPIPGKAFVFNFVKDSLLTVFLGVYIFALEHPVIMTVMVALSLGLMAVLTWQLGSALRWLWFQLSAMVTRLTSLVFKRKTSDVLAPTHMSLLEHQMPELAFKAMAQKGVSRGNLRRGYLCLFPDHLVFLYKKLFGYRQWKMETDSLVRVYFHRDTLLNIHDLHYTDANEEKCHARFVSLKNREPLAYQLAERLSARVTASNLTSFGDRIVEEAHKTAKSTADGARVALERGQQVVGVATEDLRCRIDSGKAIASETAATLSRETRQKMTEIEGVTKPKLILIRERVALLLRRLKTKVIRSLHSTKSEEVELQR